MIRTHGIFPTPHHTSHVIHDGYLANCMIVRKSSCQALSERASLLTAGALVGLTLQSPHIPYSYSYGGDNGCSIDGFARVTIVGAPLHRNAIGHRSLSRRMESHPRIQIGLP
jgi:hypothetical protein